jgi:hypothetical protein
MGIAVAERPARCPSGPSQVPAFAARLAGTRSDALNLGSDRFDNVSVGENPNMICQERLT